MIDTLTQQDLDLLDQWDACEESLPYRKVGQLIADIPQEYRDWALYLAMKRNCSDIIDRLLAVETAQKERIVALMKKFLNKKECM